MKNDRKQGNYLRHLSGSSPASIDQQKLTLQKDGVSKPRTYDMKLEIPNSGEIKVTVKDDSMEEAIPESAKDPVALMTWILNEPKIDPGKLRVHMAYNLCRMYMTLAKQKGIHLHWYDESVAPKQMRSLKEKDGNIILRKETLDTSL
jgi:hypothetical protein